ncbi:MAG: hypothetical protein QM790_17520 [Nibricoccus sp.]
MCDIIINVCGLIISGLIGLLTALLIEKAKRPSLHILTCDHTEHKINGLPMRSVHLLIRHSGVRCFKKWIYPAPALACVVRIRIFREDGVEALPAPFDARWTGSQQPPEFQIGGNGIWPSVFEMLKKRDIFPHTEEKVDICIKYQGEDSCYVFNNSSYVLGYKSEKQKLLHGSYIVEATVQSGDIAISKRVRLRNDFPKDDFRIEEIQS